MGVRKVFCSTRFRTRDSLTCRAGSTAIRPYNPWQIHAFNARAGNYQHRLTEQCGKLHTSTRSTLWPFIKTCDLLIMKMAHHLVKMRPAKLLLKLRVRQQVEREVAGLCPKPLIKPSSLRCSLRCPLLCLHTQTHRCSQHTHRCCKKTPT